MRNTPIFAPAAEGPEKSTSASPARLHLLSSAEKSERPQTPHNWPNEENNTGKTNKNAAANENAAWLDAAWILQNKPFTIEESDAVEMDRR